MDSFEVNVDENENESIDVNVHKNVIHKEEPIESKMSKKWARNYSSLVWNFFEKPVIHSDEKVRSKCKYCLKDYVGFSFFLALLCQKGEKNGCSRPLCSL